MSDNSLIKKIRQSADTHFSAVQAIRQHIHAHPELSFKEFNTAKYIGGVLHQHGLTFKPTVNTGLVGVLASGDSNKVVGLRADMDALPIQETNTTEYVSKNDGVMHACGHDVHAACLMGALMILQDVKEHWQGRVKFLFQPGEELLPGGASLMIKEGALENPVPAALLGQHVQTDIPMGKVGFKAGMYMASCDEIYITVHGKGGHAAMPKNVVNPLFGAAHVLQSMEKLIQEYGNDPANPIVINFGNIHGKGATNVVPDVVTIDGTLRAMNEPLRKKLQQTIVETAQRAAAETGCTCDVHIDVGYPYLHNDETITHYAQQSAEAYLGKENVLTLPLRMTSEDFSYYTHHVPACFYRLGTGNPAKGIISPVHTSTFDIDEEALRTGMGLMAWLTIQELERL